MNKIFICFIFLSTMTLVVHSLFFTAKFKDGCDPNPCKHKAKCILDAKNKNISTCECPDGYHGKTCDLKTGCSSKPCRHGTCTNDRLNPSNYTCKCASGMVGPKCDTADACLKNPCKTGKCSLDAKLKAVCACPLGMTSKNCDKRNCTITKFKGKQFHSKSNVYIDKQIEKKVADLDALAKICGCKIVVTRSFSLQPDATKLADNANAPFYIGRGLQVEINGNDDKLLCNSVCLGKTPIPQQPAKCLFDGLNAIGWKWSILHPGVIYDALHLTNLTHYNKLKEHHQVGCKEMKF